MVIKPELHWSGFRDMQLYVSMDGGYFTGVPSVFNSGPKTIYLTMQYMSFMIFKYFMHK